MMNKKELNKKYKKNNKKSIKIVNTKSSPSLPKKLIFSFLLLFLIGMGVWFVMGDVNITPVYPTTNITTIEDFINFSTNITLDGSDSIINLTSTWNGVTTIEKDSSLLAYFNMNNISTLSCQTGYENDTCIADITGNGNDAKIINKGIYNYGKYDNGYSIINHVNTTMEYLNFTSPFKDVSSSNFTVSFQAQMFPTIQNDKAIVINLVRWVGVGYFNMYSGRTTRTFGVHMNLKNTTGSNKDFGCGTSNLTQLYDGQWHQFAYSWNNETKTVKIYVDGILMNTCQDTDSSHTSFFGSTTFSDSVNSYVGSFPTSFGTLNNLAINGSVDELKIWNRTLSDSEIAISSHSYLKRYDATNYEYFNNYSLNYSSRLINSTNPTYQNNHSLCVINSSSITTCFLQNITQNLKTTKLISNFSDVVGILGNYRFGFNVHSVSYFISDSQYLWHQQKWEEIPSSKFARIDQSLDSFFTGSYNFNLEDFYNTSVTYVGNTGGFSEVAQGWGVSWQFGNGTAGRSTDAHSGDYSLFLNSTGGTLYIDKGEKSTSMEDDIFIEPNHQYNISFWVKGQGNISSSMQLQYGAYPQCGGLSSTSANNTDWIQYSYLCNTPSDLNSSTYRFTLNINSWGNITFDDWNITDTATGTYPEFWLKDSSKIQYWQDRFDYLFSTGSMPEIITSYMPKFMANFSGYCYNVSDSSRDYGDCPPKDNDLYGRVNKYWWDLITENGTRYDMSQFADESYNEADIGFFMDMLSGGNILKTQPYIDMTNATFFYMNKSYPQVILLAPAVAGGGCKNPENYYMINASITNFSGVYPTFQLAGHCYQHDLNYGLLQGTDRVANLYTALGKTFNGVWWDEYNFGYGGSGDTYANWIKNTSSRFNEWENYIASDTIRMMSKYPNSSHVGVYQWTDNCIYGIGCGEYPTRYSSVSSPSYENTTYPEYWVIANLSMVCQDGGNVFNTYSESSAIPIISCNKGNQYGIAVTNDLNESRVIPINLSMNNGTIKYPYNNITNLKTKEIYPVIGDVLTLTIDAKQTYYLSSGIPPTITSIQPANLTINTTSQVNFSANLTDDVGLTNSTLNIMNKVNKNLSTHTINYVSGEQSVLQSWQVSLTNGDKYWWISLWDDEGKNTISGNYSITIDSAEGYIHRFKLNEGSGNTIYDSLQNLSNGVKSGATWVTDGILNTLASGVDYTVDLVTGLLTLDTDYLYEYLFVDYDYNKVFGFHVSILNVIAGFLMIVVLGVGIIYVVKYFKNIKELE
jgi:hypothetical protein